MLANSNQTYAIFIYNCDHVSWSDGATIGYNAAGDFFENHPLSGLLHANTIGCVHVTEENMVPINNVVYDLVPTGMVNMTTPPTIRHTLGMVKKPFSV